MPSNVSLFTQERVAASARQFLDALFGNEPRKTPSRAISQANDCNQQESRSLIAPATF
jgi:hypothetical protein